MSSICDERGAELLYAGMPITEIFKVGKQLSGCLFSLKNAWSHTRALTRIQDI